MYLTLAHENIVRVKEMVVGDATDQVFMVMTCFDRDLKSCLRDHEGLGSVGGHEMPRVAARGGGAHAFTLVHPSGHQDQQRLV